MSFVIATTELVQGATTQLAAIGTSLAEASAAVSGPTTAIATAAQDEVSLAIAALFANFGREFQTVNGQAQAFHSRFVNLLNSSAGAYASAEAVNAAAATSVDPLTRWAQVFNTTAKNAQASFGAVPAGLNTLVSGVSTGLNQLATNPAAFVGNLRNAAQSVFLLGADEQLGWSVAHHTLGGNTQAVNGSVEPPEIVDVPDVHLQLYQGFVGLGDFSTGSGLATALVNFASSPASGVLIGAVSPLISPAVALWNSAGSVFADITGGNPTGALYGLINTPANVVDGFFNGATLNLDALAPVFDPWVYSGSLGKEHLEGLTYTFGGLFSPGEVVTGASGPEFYGTGGSMLNGLGPHLSFHPPDDFAGGYLNMPGWGVGPIAAGAGLLSVLGHALGGSLLVPLPA
ncbi:PE family protein [Mycobacterium intermedium]|uniref:PE family protein n=1 Tax=Mycobacterium intermedium TaxID=28445 RepID=A0A1E3SE98_MYCIE|nr:outer membrane porin GjpA [Mycobacterium intermedium]MCV6967641.1 PE family protein [Mycobacterium intermedium]ODR00450.1 hypothetical protein BHQ20_12835 [Mycobacterium intermedium]ORB09380.1 PE family protein [Mycobacterium intermedium]